MRRMILLCVTITACGYGNSVIEDELAFRILFPARSEMDIASKVDRIEIIKSFERSDASQLLKLVDSWSSYEVLDQIKSNQFILAARNFEYSPILCTFEQSQESVHAFIYMKESKSIGHMELRFCAGNGDRFVGVSYLSPSGDLDYVFSSQVLAFMQ